MPREDLRKSQPLDASEFAIHLDQVIEGRAAKDYTEPDRFFARTFLTRRMREVTAGILRRLAGEGVGSSPGVNLTTQFGGGKTHTLTLLYYLGKHGEASHPWVGVRDLLKEAGLDRVPKARVAAFIGNRFDFVRGTGRDGEPKRRTPWGDIAWQLGGPEGYAQVEQHDQEGIVPGGEVLQEVLSGGPSLILMDEVLSYIRRAREAGGQYARVGSQLYSFLDVLTREAMGQPGIVLACSLPMSEYEMTQEDIAEFQRLSKLLERLAQPILLSEGMEIAEIIRRRLFEDVGDPKEVRRTARDFTKWVSDHREQLPQWFHVDDAQRTFEASYPFHPSLLSVFERKWQSLPNFQRTRGILRTLALWVSELYQEAFMAGHRDPLIGLGTAPLADSYFRAEAFEQLGEHRLEAAVLSDIAGEESWAVRLDAAAPDTIKRARLHQKVAAAVFFESSGGQVQEWATLPEIRLAVGEPGIDIGNVETVLDDLRSAYYLRVEGTRYWFSHKANVEKLVADRRATISDTRAEEKMREAIRSVFDAGPKVFERRYFPEESGSLPNVPSLTLAVLSPEHSWEPALREATKQRITSFIQECAGVGRTYKSALLFSVPHSTQRLKDEAKKLLALESLEGERDRLQLDESDQKDLRQSKERSQRDLKENVWRAYRYLVLLGEDGKPREIDLGLQHSSGGESLVGLIAARLRQEGLLEESVSADFVVRNWPPALEEWSTKGVRDTFYASPQFPRLSDWNALRTTIAEGVRQGRFGYASKSQAGTYQTAVIEDPGFGPANVEFSDEVVLLPREKALSLKEGAGKEPVAIRDRGEGHEAGSGEEEPGPPTAPPTGVIEAERLSTLLWEGEVPPQKWMNFYTRVVSRFATGPGLKLRVQVEASPETGVTREAVEETKRALRELGLSDAVEEDLAPKASSEE
jgi:hypothetical protein